MATVRPTKSTPLKKGPDSNQGSPAPGRRTPAWSNRASPSPGPAFNANARGTANGFPPLGGQTNGKPSTNSPNAWGSAEDKQQLLAGLAGSINQTITVALRTNTRYEGILTFVSPSASDDASLTLKNAKDLSTPNAPPKDTVKIPASNVLSFSPGSSGTGTMSKVQDSFRTDAEISRIGSAKRERELQAWQPDAEDASATPAGNGHESSRGDDVTFGPGATSGAQWDQFAANERLFGVRTQFNEDVYTTPLDRTAKDYKEKERLAERIAAEIQGSATNNPHLAEERGISVDDSGVNEEDKYGAVVRGANAYVPPGARRQATGSDTSAPPSAKGPDKDKDKDKDKDNQTKPDASVPKVSVNAPDGSEKVLPRPTASPSNNTATKQPADALPAFRDFVTNEKQRLTQKKQALVKNEMEKRVAELVKFSQNFKLNKPIPDDLVPILAKDEDKQRQIREKSTQDAQSTKARAIGVSASVLTTNTQQKVSAGTPSKPIEPMRKPPIQPMSATKPDRVPASKSSNVLQGNAAATSSAPASKSNEPNAKLESSKTMPRISMAIQPIPPFRGPKKQGSGDGKTTPSSGSSQPLSPTSQQRLNVNATSFRPNPKAAAFTPTGSTSPQVQAQTISPKPNAASTPATPNLFFGTQVIKKTPPVNIKDDFNPFKSGKVQEPKTTTPNWPYSGKRYMQLFPPPPTAAAPPPQASPHMAPHGPPPPPPPSYDEDAAAQAQAAAASRGYAVYAYAPYYPGQPPQPMMPGMAGVPPGAFIPSPYMQPMPYPPNMHPPNGQPMYAPPPMGQMPPPQQYMPPPPPPGAYPPPPNSGGPRPSMPPTPIPAHAHPYYHQSPQLQHAMPYPMMMPPPAPNGPPHHYEGGPPPPVPMGGVGHA